MLRVEIIANHSVEENILDAFAREGVGKFYTKYPSVFGVGSSGPRMGDAVWPEENFSLVIWCGEEEARGIVRAVAAVKKQFPDEGIRVFGLPDQISRFPPGALYPGQGAAFAPVETPAPSGGHAGAGAAPGAALPSVAPAATPAGEREAPRSWPAPATPAAVPATPASPVPGYTAPPSSAPAYHPVPPPPPVYGTPPGQPLPPAEPSGIVTAYDGQNMDEEY